MKIILASLSPRRKEIMELAGYHFDIASKNIVEDFPPHLSHKEIPMHIALQKAKAVAADVDLQNTLVIGADTIVVVNGEILGKPTDKADALRMLQLLQNNRHEVHTGVAILHQTKEIVFVETTSVFFNPLSVAACEYYIEKYQPFDKAGGYACQEWIGARAINRFEGDYYNVVGLPIYKVSSIIDPLMDEKKD